MPYSEGVTSSVLRQTEEAIFLLVIPVGEALICLEIGTILGTKNSGDFDDSPGRMTAHSTT
jgi:hypothetical protein